MLGVLLVALLASGCAVVPYRAHPDLAQRLSPGKTLALLPPDVKVYELGAGGVPELMDDWSALGRRHAADALARTLAERNFTIKEFIPDPTDTRLVETLEDVRALVEAVRSAVMIHTYHPNLTIEEKRQNFRYSVGPLPELADATGADALVFVSGVDHISTAGRKALMVLGVLVGAAAGVYAGPAAGVSQLTAVVVEPRTGDVLWFNLAAAGGGADLREADSVAPLAKTLLTGFGPEPRGP